MDFDVIVVGGGPAGSLAARTIAKRGWNVLVLEEHGEIGKPINCGEGLSHDTIVDFSYNPEDIDFINNDVKLFKMYLPGNNVILLDIEGHVIDREKFDKYNMKLALEAGATLDLNHVVKSVQIEKNQVKVSGKEKSGKSFEYTARMVIGADGPRATVARSVGLEKPAKMVYGHEWQMTLPDHDENALEFYFDAEKFPLGYAWIFPKGNKIYNVGLVTSEVKNKERLENFVKELDLDGNILKRMGGLIPRSGPIKKPFTERTLITGDAAGLTNIMFYGGIKIAMKSGQIAGLIADESLKKNKFSENFLKKYLVELKRYKFMSPHLKKAHEFWYSFTNEELAWLGEKYNGWNLTRLSFTKKILFVLKALGSVQVMTNIGKYYSLFKALRITLEWGF